jgi:hypothetical protein
MRAFQRGAGRRTQSCVSAFVALLLGAGCAVDDLNRLGAGRASISNGPDAGRGDGQLDDPLRPDTSVAPTVLDAGAPPITADAGLSGDGPELMPNPGFELGHEGWVGFGDSRIFDVIEAHGGSRAILSTNRARTWEGPSYDILSLVQAGKPYAISVWVRNELDTHTLMLTLKASCGDDTTYTRLATRVVASSWQQLEASFFAPDCADLGELSLYVEGPPAYQNVLVDDVSLRTITLPASSDSGSASPSP